VAGVFLKEKKADYYKHVILTPLLRELKEEEEIKRKVLVFREFEEVCATEVANI